MNKAIKKCPKCGYCRQPQDASSFDCCPSCGLYFEKWALRDISTNVRKSAPVKLESAWRERLTAMPQKVDHLWLATRAGLLLVFLIWGWRLVAMDYRNGEIGSSFMHLILLPFHEAGHVLFIPFGQFMTILGGSLFQLLMPLIVAASLFWQNRDPIGAAFGLWWCGVSLIDLAPYIYDAKTPQLILLGGHTGEEGPHDWIYLLGVISKLEHAHRYGFIAHRLGVLVMSAALIAAAVLLLRVWKMWRE